MNIISTAFIQNLPGLTMIQTHLETRENEKIRAIKDMAAAAVGISIVVWFTVVIFDVVRLLSTISERSLR